jgi:hypothetical protein
MSQKHLTKKELKEDPFFEEVSHLIGFYQKYRKQIIIFGIIIMLMLVAFFAAKSMSESNTNRAAGYFGIGLDYYMKNMLPAAEDQFLIVATEYRQTSWGKRANYYLGMIARGMGQSDDEILSYLETFTAGNVKDDALKTSAYQLIAAIYYRNGDLTTAGENYFMAAKHALSKKEKMDYGIRAGEAFLDANQPQKRDEVVAYLKTQDMDDLQKARIDLLAKR